jgi:hypothetical protein
MEKIKNHKIKINFLKVGKEWPTLKVAKSTTRINRREGQKKGLSPTS